ncbi:MAG: hypothetical protein C0608_09035 [Deltaproteobacteria bacterium]|nr:MAG: hypothetical protein C0608_09035 [Deltaproteobacteria bacterium]
MLLTLGSKRKKGFTLVELMITVAVIAILALVAAPGLFIYIPTYKVNSATKALTAQLQLARAEAIAKNLDYRIRIDQSGQTLFVERIEDDNSVTLIKKYLFELSGRANPDFPGVKVNRPSGVSFPPQSITENTSAAIAFGVPGGSATYNQLTFMPNGISNYGGEFYITHSSNTELYNTRAVQVQRAGIIRAFKYTPPDTETGDYKWEGF